ncbi:MAG TPA: hypothetical protein VMU24_02375 [Candidatus Acidoferrales bacterium]|nr:hypothetical protein [Candidatus Acidoferrales bacterium]
MNEHDRYQRYCAWCRDVIGCDPAPLFVWRAVLKSLPDYGSLAYLRGLQ